MSSVRTILNALYPPNWSNWFTAADAASDNEETASAKAQEAKEPRPNYDALKDKPTLLNLRIIVSTGKWYRTNFGNIPSIWHGNQGVAKNLEEVHSIKLKNGLSEELWRAVILDQWNELANKVTKGELWDAFVEMSSKAFSKSITNPAALEHAIDARYCQIYSDERAQQDAKRSGSVAAEPELRRSPGVS